MIDRNNFDDGFACYRIRIGELSGSGYHHYHFICLKNGKIWETTDFGVSDHEVKLYGCCNECGGRTD